MNIQSIIDFIVPFGKVLRSVDTSRPFSNVGKIALRAIGPTFFFYWVCSFIPVVGTLVYGLVFVPLSARLHTQQKHIQNKTERFSIYLLYFTVIIIGFGGLWSFIGHTLLADSIAQQIGWATGSPFQTELAFYTLGSAVAGLMALWLRGHMITALVISKSIFWYGAAYVHIYDAVVNRNYSAYNIGTPLFADIIYPTVLLVLLLATVVPKRSHVPTPQHVA